MSGRILLPLVLVGACLAPVRAHGALPSDAAADTLLRPRWALVLSGGVARGIAHVGVLRAIEEQGLRPDLVVGTSMGALVGALWASGRTSDELQRIFKDNDTRTLFDPAPGGFEWRGTVATRPWITLFGGGPPLRLPTGVLDDAGVNDLLARYLLLGDALAQTDFDRLPVPFRAVETDAGTLDPVVIDSGSVARAVRASISLPLLFPAVWMNDRLLVDGGISKNLGIVAAHAESSDHVLAIDVALPIGTLSEYTPALRIGLAVLQQTSRSGRGDAISGVDTVLWLKMPGIQPADLWRVDELVRIGYRESRPLVAQLARDWHLPRVARPDTSVRLPPLGRITWVRRDGTPARQSVAAGRQLGTLPDGPFEPGVLSAPLARVARSDLFTSAWPRFVPEGGATDVRIEVRERPAASVEAIGGIDRDIGWRANASLTLRPLASRASRVFLSGTARSLGSEAYLSLEPHSLARGGNGWFVRTGARRIDHRIFAADRSFTRVRTDRLEALAGGQWSGGHGYLLQAGVGGARSWSDDLPTDAPIAVLRIETVGRATRTLDAVAAGGSHPYTSFAAHIGHHFKTPVGSLTPTVFAGWASLDAPLDEQHGVGGPATLAGLRRDEWYGRQAYALDLRLTRSLVNSIDASIGGQVAQVRHAVSRTDFDQRFRFGAVASIRAALPFGPLDLSYGVSEGGAKRFDASFGQEF
jgi:predicted acylesterase/phospholipase RssA